MRPELCLSRKTFGAQAEKTATFLTHGYGGSGWPRWQRGCPFWGLLPTLDSLLKAKQSQWCPSHDPRTPGFGPTVVSGTAGPRGHCGMLFPSQLSRVITTPPSEHVGSGASARYTAVSTLCGTLCRRFSSEPRTTCVRLILLGPRVYWLSCYSSQRLRDRCSDFCFHIFCLPCRGEGSWLSSVAGSSLPAGARPWMPWVGTVPTSPAGAGEGFGSHPPGSGRPASSFRGEIRFPVSPSARRVYRCSSTCRWPCRWVSGSVVRGPQVSEAGLRRRRSGEAFPSQAPGTPQSDALTTRSDGTRTLTCWPQGEDLNLQQTEGWTVGRGAWV